MRRAPAGLPGATAALAVCVALLGGCGDGEGSEPAPDGMAAGERPNLIVVMTDDQTVESFGPDAMPFTWRLFNGERASIFSNALAVPPLCCPARAGFLTGQYPHNHGILANVPGYAALRDKANVLPAWLAERDYRTSFVGKYLNEYTPVGGAEPAPGWKSWLAYHVYPAYFDYTLSDGGKLRRYGEGRGDYSTYRFTERAVAEIEDPEREGPLFMWLAQNAPHLSSGTRGVCDNEVATPPSADAYRRFADEPLPRDPSYDEKDRSDKPRPISDRSPISEREERVMTVRWRCALASLRAVDSGMREIVRALEEVDELEDTVLVFVSDNGYFFGEHAIGKDKRLPYRASAEVPMAVRVGSRVQPEAPPPVVRELVGTFDLAPTLLDYARAEPCIDESDCRPVDGRSLRPLLDPARSGYPEDRAILLELDERNADAYVFTALRTRRYLLSRMVRDRSGRLPRPAFELYDLREDPYELENLWALDRERARELARELRPRLERLAGCQGSEEELFESVGGGDCE